MKALTECYGQLNLLEREVVVNTFNAAVTYKYSATAVLLANTFLDVTQC